MPFGRKNAGATYQRLVDKAFDSQVGRNIEVYVDDLVIKSHTEAEMPRDIDETFRTLREINMKLNPKNYTFGAVEGMFLGLNGKLASLNIFLSKSAKKSLPLFKTLKKCIKKSDFHWTPDAEQAFKQLKQHLSELPLLVAPKPKEELIVYLSASHRAINRSGDGLILTSPEGTEFTYALRFQFTASNNEAEYEALIAGLRIIADEKYLKEGTLPEDKKEASKLHIKARQYELWEGVLYRRSFLKPWLRCVGPVQADYVIREIHEGSCSMHA
ncbi:reverse transcriptase domain-containing protein [Tanacetum coccineum]